MDTFTSTDHPREVSDIESRDAGETVDEALVIGQRHASTEPAMKPLILLVDDDEDERFLARDILEKAGFIIEEAENGRDGLEKFQNLAPAVVLMDVMMPEMDGFEACAALRAAPKGPNTPVIMMTGLDDTKSINRAYEVGATTFFTKPIDVLIVPHLLRFVVRAKQAADELRESRAQLSRAQQIAKLGHWTWNLSSTKLWCSKGAPAIFGRTQDATAFTFRDFLKCVHPEDRLKIKNIISDSLRTKTGYNVQYSVLTPDNRQKFLYQEAEYEFDYNNNIKNCFGIVQDITDIKEYCHKIYTLSNYDPVTKLPNQNFMRNVLQHVIESAKRYDRLASVLFLDIDKFQRVNDTLGHSLADRLLGEIANRLRASIRSSDNLLSNLSVQEPSGDALTDRNTVTRLGGDEFVIILDQIRNAEDGARTAKRIAADFAEPFVIDGNEIAITFSIGISIFPGDGHDVDQLVKTASTAAHYAKQQGRNCSRFYTKTLNENAMRRFSLENRLRKALDHDEMRLFYQPIVDLRSGNIVGAEALLRWIGSANGLVPPNDFIPIAEETGLIVPIGEWVLRTACEHAASWQRDGLSLNSIAVNISAGQFRCPKLTQQITDILAATELDARYLHLELTEGMLLSDTHDTISMLNELNMIGLSISIDDFGTGYSSLAYLKKFPLHSLKIDRSFVKDIVNDPDDAAIVNATIGLAHNLRLSVIAEGVENRDQLAFLQAYDCEQAQGFLFGRPCPSEEFEHQLRTQPKFLLSQNAVRTSSI